MAFQEKKYICSLPRTFSSRRKCRTMIKRRLECCDDGGDGSASVKRVKLEDLLDHLSLDTHKPQYHIPPTAHAVSAIDKLFAAKLRSHCAALALARLLLLPAYCPTLLVVVRFRKWLVRMFNRFLARYNRSHNMHVPRVSHVSRVVSYISQGHLSLETLNLILLEESRLLLEELHVKRVGKAESRVQELERDCWNARYSYWDTIGVRTDVEMLPAGPETPRSTVPGREAYLDTSDDAMVDSE